MKKIVFVYNANAGLFSALTDSAHKLLSPKTYSCNLCKLTYGLKNMKQEWADFIKTLPYPLEFLHRDELHKQHPELKDVELPAVFMEEAVLNEWVPASEINKVESLPALKELITKYLDQKN